MKRDFFQNKFGSRRSLRAAGLALFFGAGWLFSSGLQGLPAKITTNTTSVQLSLPYRGLCQRLDLFEGGRPLTPIRQDVNGGLARVSLELSEGTHLLTLSFGGPIPGVERTYQTEIVVDRTAPPLHASLEGMKAGQSTTIKDSVTLMGHTEPGAGLTLEEQTISVAEDGTFKLDYRLQPGWNHLLLSAADPAGNRKKITFSLFRDVKEPELVWQTEPDKVYKTNQARLEVNLSDDGKIAAVSGKVDDRVPVTFLAKGEGRWVGLTPELHEGEHTVTVKAADAAGRTVSSRRQVLIDSSETLGEAVLGLGARGADVKLLHERLMEAGCLPRGPVTEKFDKTTEQALKKFQKAQGFQVTGRADRESLVALGPRIYINLANFSLVLDRPGQKERRWMVASGSYDHPTPTGEFVVWEKVTEPTWLPPKSDWAKDAEPIPPGPDNPLGTRWIGFDWGGVGIHGTNAPWTVGSAASHGCLRMVTAEVEELFELVEVGTPVVVLSGSSDDPLVEKYWPANKPSQSEESTTDELAKS